MRTHPRTASGGRGRAGTSHVRRSRSDRATLHTAPTSDPAATDGCTGTPPTHHAAAPEPAPARRLRDDRGVSILEFVGFLPILLLVGLAAIQLGLIGYGVNQAGTGARAAARVASQGGDGGTAGTAAVSGWLDPNVSLDGGPGADLTTATVTVTVPNVIPLFGRYPVTRHATMPTDD
ncbi:TadE/TadG family type IV pilus assembly protein [Streptomyces sp. NPDC096324]|uniref:TadE/TadG family type IV pilus assembly protein n=1 Tax=Streptomyces sp. NPDC096324 TaxID=3366085 RepID=UPI003826D6B9